MYDQSCSLPILEDAVITLAHGSGGKQTQKLINEVFLSAFRNRHLELMHDGAELVLPSNRVVFTTDSFIVQPVFFPGGDIGKLAVTGTMNDLAMCGALPLYLSCGFIIEEGFSRKDLAAIVNSMQLEAQANGVEFVAGDTKVIERQTGKNLFINTSGIGVKMVDRPINPRQICPGDAIVLSGDIGRHGMAVMAAREGLQFAAPFMSDCASLVPLVQALLHKSIDVRCLRDLTRGGLATALVEIAEASEMDLEIDEGAIAICESVSSVAEVLGIDPMYVANEGRFIAFVPKSDAEEALCSLRQCGMDGASVIGYVGIQTTDPKVLLKNGFGVQRRLYRLSGDQLPRIC